MFRNLPECSVFLVLSTANYGNNSSLACFHATIFIVPSFTHGAPIKLEESPWREHLPENGRKPGKECGSILSSDLWGGTLRDDTKNGCVADYRGRGGGEYKITVPVFTCHHASLQAEFVETIGGNVVNVVRVTVRDSSEETEEFELHIVLGLPDHPHERHTRICRT